MERTTERSTSGRLTVDDLAFRYNEGSDVLHGISFNTSPGETLGVMGPSGSGKSTLLRILAGILAPTSGTVVALGEEPKSLARSGAVSFAFQQPALLPWRTCIDNVTLPLTLLGRDCPQVLLHQLFESFGLRGTENKLPHELSGGMAQRAAVARSLVTEPRLLLLDEPLSSVDWPLRCSILVSIRQFCLSRHTNSVVVSHDARELAFLAKRVIVLDAGTPTGVREFVVPDMGNSIETFRQPEFFKTTVALDDFAYPTKMGVTSSVTVA